VSTEKSLFERAVASATAADLKNCVFGEMSLENTGSDEFTKMLDERLDQLIIQGIQHVSLNSLSEKQQFDIALMSLWGAWRSIGTFALQIARCDEREPKHEQLRELLVKQIDDEYRHYRLAQKCVEAMGAEARGLELRPEESSVGLSSSFDYFDKHYTDPLMAAGIVQFADQRMFLHFAASICKQSWIVPALKTYLEKTIPDSGFHIYIGRLCVQKIALQGSERREELLNKITDTLFRFTLPKILTGQFGQLAV